MRRTPAEQPLWLGTLPYGLIGAAVLLRLMPHPWHFQPMDALALFGGAVLPGAWAVAVPLGAVALSDAVLGFYGAGMLPVYAAYLAIIILGRVMLRRRSPLGIAGTAAAAATLFYLITNLGEWFGPLYPHTLAGLAASYTAGVPFFPNTLMSDVAYSLAIFGVYDAARRAGRIVPQRTT